MSKNYNFGYKSLFVTKPLLIVNKYNLEINITLFDGEIVY